MPWYLSLFITIAAGVTMGSLTIGYVHEQWQFARYIGEACLGVIVIVGALCLHDAIMNYKPEPRPAKTAEKAAVDVPTVERMLTPGTHILLGDHVTVLTFKGRFTAAAQNKVNGWWSVIDSLPRNQ